MTKSTSVQPVGRTNISKYLVVVLVVGMIVGALWVRTIDLGADPLDVAHPQQLFFLLTARSFQPAPGLKTAGLPTSGDYISASRDFPLLQIAAAGVSGALNVGLTEAARILSVLGWVMASLLVFFLLRKITHTLIAVAALALMLFMPYAIEFSRVVLPGSWALFFTILGLWMLWRWLETPSWKSAVLCGVYGLVAVMLEPEVLFILGGALVPAAILHLKKSSDQQWMQILVIGAFLIVPRYAYELAMHSNAGLIGNWLGIDGIPLKLSALKQISRLELRTESIIGALGIGFAVLGILLTAKGVKRSLLTGMWVGFGLFCLLSLNSIANSIYLLYPLIFLTALSLVSIMEALLERISELKMQAVSAAVLVAVLIVGAGLGMLDGRRLVKANPDQIPVDFWRSLGKEMGPSSVFLTNTDSVNLPLAYYGKVRPVCLQTSGCLASVGQAAQELKDYQVYFVTFQNSLEQDPAISFYFDPQMLHCDAGSGITVFPITYKDSFCKVPVGKGTSTP